jgi:hypothetical protein
MEKMTTSANAVLVSYVASKKSYERYQMKLAAKIGITSAGLVASISVIASTPFHFGTATVPAIIGMAKCSVELAHDVNTTLKSVDDSINEALEVITNVLEDYDKKNGHKKGLTKEVTNAVLEAFFSVKVFESTLSTATEKIKLAQNKLNGAEVRLHELSKLLGKSQKRLLKLKMHDPHGKKPEKLAEAEKTVAALKIKFDKKEGKFAERREKLKSAKELYEKLGKFKHTGSEENLKIFKGFMKIAEIALALGTAEYAEAAENAVKLADLLIVVSQFTADQAVTAYGNEVAAAMTEKLHKKILSVNPVSH